MACDMIDMDQETLIKVMKAANQIPGKEFYVYKNQTHYEPFAGIYTAAGLHQVYDLYRKKILKGFSMQHVLNAFKTYSLSSENNEAAFRNYNN